ncbi:MAG: exodeoxyribonuclease VII large subunit [Bacillota bacterium]
MEERIFSVGEIANIIKRIFSAEEHLHGILLSGEVTNIKRSGNHVYFSIKDEDSTMFCTYFNGGIGGKFIPKNGEKVLVRCSIDFYVKGGSLGLRVSQITPAGLGALYLKFVELKAQLESEGLFDENHKKPIPKDVKNIGVVTSETGAVIRDIINVTTRRNPFVNIMLYPAKVQGDGSAQSITKALRALDKSGKCDVIIVGRGGGSFEDLNCFNEELVVRAVYGADTPIISAVGHETDFTLCDFASDLRAPTPSAASELAVSDLVSEVRAFKQKAGIMKRNFESKTERMQTKFLTNASKLQLHTQKVLSEATGEMNLKTNKLTSAVREKYVQKRNEIKLRKEKIESLSPIALLDRGYSKLLSDGKSVKSIADVSKGSEIKSFFADGTVTSIVEKIEVRK